MRKINILGDGQLGRMLYQASFSLGLECQVIGNNRTIKSEDKLSFYQRQNVIYTYIPKYNETFDKKDIKSMIDIIGSPYNNIITFEYENISLNFLESLKRYGYIIYPDHNILKYCNKLFMRQKLSLLGIDMPNFITFDKMSSINQIEIPFQYPVIIKTTYGGYDGKGVYKVCNKKELWDVYQTNLQSNINIFCEEYIKYDYELAIQIACSTKQETVIYNPVKVFNTNNICDEVHAPLSLTSDQLQYLYDTVYKIRDLVGLCGLMTVELFKLKDRLLLNELAFRPHNTGHWSMDGSKTSQFEQHLRAISGLPLGSVDMLSDCVVSKNILGNGNVDCHNMTLAMEYDRDIKVHMYDKKEFSINRKLGHANIIGEDDINLTKRVNEFIDKLNKIKE